MIFIEIIFFILTSLILTLSLAGFGQLLNFKSNNNFFINIFYGLIVIAFLITIIHFFIKINVYLSFSLTLIGFFLGIQNIHFLKEKTKKNLLIYFLIFLILIPIYITQKYHEDFGYYHLPYVINMISEKIIFGLGNVNRAFVHNSIWLNVISFFYLKDNINLITLPSFISYIIFLIFSVNEIIKKNKNLFSNYFLIVIAFYLILKFTRISEFGNDIPSIIFSALSIYFFFRFIEEDEIEKKNIYFFNNFSFSTFAILIKFSSIPVILLTFYLFLKNFRTLKNQIFNLNYLFIYALGIIFFLQQFIYTGCFIFPSEKTCLDVSWFDQNSLNAKYKLELVNKGYFGTSAKEIFTGEEYLKNFNWIPFWFQRNYTGMLEHLATMIFPLILFLLVSKKRVNQISLKFKEISFFILFIIFGFIFWISFSPVFRFGIVYFLSLVFISSFFIYKKIIFSKKIFLSLIFLFLFFNFSKNIERINTEKHVFFGIKKIENNFIENPFNENSLIQVFQPDQEANEKKGNGWQGRLCWDIKFLCTKNKIEITKKNNYLIIKKQEK